MRARIPLDTFDKRPQEMEQYLKHYGWHFNRKLVEFAVGKMKRHNPSTNRLERVEFIGKDKVDESLKKYGIELKYNELYDYVFVYNMAMTDFFKSSLPTEEMVCKYVADYVDDPDQVDGFIFNRWYADSCHKGIPIEWDDML